MNQPLFNAKTTKNVQKRSYDGTSSIFKSSTNRSHQVFGEQPNVDFYDEKRSLGYKGIQGGAPNNFLLLKNDKKATLPFSSSAKKDWDSNKDCKLNLR